MAKAPRKAPAKAAKTATKKAGAKASRQGQPRNVKAAVGAIAAGEGGRAEQIERAMADAATQASREGVTDQKEIHNRMMAARARILGE